MLNVLTKNSNNLQIKNSKKQIYQKVIYYQEKFN